MVDPNQSLRWPIVEHEFKRAEPDGDEDEADIVDAKAPAQEPFLLFLGA
jgi:hypothetical protein